MIKKYLAVTLAMLMPLAVWAAGKMSVLPTVSPKNIDALVSMQLRADGQYDVICKNDIREVVSYVDLMIGEICPKKPIVSRYISIHQTSDGQYSVVCADGTQLIATKKQITDGSICGSPPVPPTQMITSDGTKTAPHCTWLRNCTWDAETKTECAQKLCEAAGFLNGSFLSASNDMCTASFTSDMVFNWVTDENKYIYDDYGNEAQIVANCGN